MSRRPLAGWFAVLRRSLCPPCLRGGRFSTGESHVSKPTPKYLAMLLCDYVIRDGDTQNKSLIGIWNSIFAQRFPVRHDRMHIFVSLTDGHGEYRATIRIRGASGKEIFSRDGKLAMKDPLAVADLNFQIRGLVIPKPGRYFVEFLCDGEPIVERRFDAAKIERKKKAEE